MKITTLLLVTAILQVSASSFAQKITLSEKNASIKTVFNKIRSQCGYDFMVTKSALDAATPVTIEVKNGELKDVLEKIFSNQPLEYEVTDKFVNIKVKEKSFFSKVLDAVLAKNISGKVVDQNGDPLQGATVAVVGVANATTTSTTGVFMLQNVAEDAVIRVSFIGYVTRDLKASDDFSLIKLSVNESKLDEIKVIAYGTTTERLSTGSYSTLTAKDIEKQPVNNILDALTGRLPGLQITPTSGIQGAAPRVNIRGQVSIANQTEPLYILDGVPVTASQALQTTGALDNNSFNLLTTLNTADVESVSVLKDADALAIYGSRGSNGVILITTKRGKAKKTTTNLKLSTGFAEVPHFINMLDIDQYLAMRQEAYTNDGLVPSTNPTASTYAPDLFDLGNYNKNQPHNWQKEFLGRKAISNDLGLSFSGGSENTRYFMSAGYHKEGTVMSGDSKYIRKSFMASIGNTSPNKKFTLDAQTSYSESTLNLLPADLVNYINRAPNNQLYKADGSPNWDTATFPLSFTLQNYFLPTKNFSLTGLASYEFIPGLKLKATAGMNSTTVNMSQEQPLVSLNPTATSAQLILQNSESKSWIVEPQLEYTRNFKNHHISALAGLTFQRSVSSSLTLTGTNFSNDRLISNISAASVITKGNTFNPYNYAAFFGRVTYDFDQELLANLTFRRDGSSRFGDSEKFGNFGAIGLGWVFSQRNWIKENAPFLSFGKIRGSYGITGNDAIGNFQFLSTLSSNSTGYNGLPSLAPSGIANSEIRWETWKKLEAAVELGFVKDRVLFTGAFFRNRSNNQLLLNNVSTQAGFFSYQANFPGLTQIQGFELELSTKNIQGPFSWNTSFNFTKSDNKLVDYPDFAASGYTFRLAIGQSLNVVKGYKFAGLNATGVPTYTYANGTVGTAPNQNVDRVVLGDTDPMYGGMSNDFSYKGFTFSFFVRYDRIVGVPKYYTANIAGSLNAQNVSTYVLGRWQKPGDEANTIIPRFTTSNSAYVVGTYQNSDQLFVNRHIFRLSNAALAYNLPASLVSKAKLNRVQLYVNAQNLYVFDKHSSEELDPQTGNNALPPLRTIVFGINASF